LRVVDPEEKATPPPEFTATLAPIVPPVTVTELEVVSVVVMAELLVVERRPPEMLRLLTVSFPPRA